MIQNPRIQIKLRQHIATQCLEAFGEITMEQLNASQTPYLEAVVHETFRLSRASPGSARLCERSRRLFGYQLTHLLGLKDSMFLGRPVPKGTEILWMHSLRYQNEHGSDGVAEHLSGMVSKSQKLGTWQKGTILDFMPERWLDGEGMFDLNAGPSLPFSHGIRACFGKSLAVSPDTGSPISRSAPWECDRFDADAFADPRASVDNRQDQSGVLPW